MDQKAINVYVRLKALVEKAERALDENPRPILEEAYDQMFRMRKVFDDIERVLSPDCVVDVATDLNIEPMYVNGIDTTRINRIRDILNKYRDGGY